MSGPVSPGIEAPVRVRPASSSLKTRLAKSMAEALAPDCGSLGERSAYTLEPSVPWDVSTVVSIAGRLLELAFVAGAIGLFVPGGLGSVLAMFRRRVRRVMRWLVSHLCPA